MSQDKEKTGVKTAGLWDFVKALATLVIVGVVSYKVYQTPINLTIDFPTLLSLLLALFSVGLAALFYFKATETSNTFYDNTYNFTKDIAQLLVKMESGFGERLKSLDEGYSSMRDYIQHSSEKPNDDVEKTKKKIESEKDEMEKVVFERNQIIQNLLEKSTLEAEEKEEMEKTLQEKDRELADAQVELSRMNKRLFAERMARKKASHTGIGDIDSGMAQFTKRKVIDKIGVNRVLRSSKDSVLRAFQRLEDELPLVYFKDLKVNGYFDRELTDEGYEYLITIAKSMRADV